MLMAVEAENGVGDGTNQADTGKAEERGQREGPSGVIGQSQTQQLPLPAKQAAGVSLQPLAQPGRARKQLLRRRPASSPNGRPRSS